MIMKEYKQSIYLLIFNLEKFEFLGL